MIIKVGPKTFNASLEDNSTVAELKSRLPMTLDMVELNGNEKYHHLSTELPTNEHSPGKIREGDIMLYGDNSLVLFYKSFSSSYKYTRIGHIDAPSALADALGKGNVKVTFENEEFTSKVKGE